MWYRALRRDLDEKKFLGILPDEALETATAICMANGVIGELEFWEEMNAVYQRPQTTAAVDSELTLALAPRYQLSKWLPNPFNARFDKFPAIAEIRQKTLMVGRLDGPTPEIARRLVDDALTVEAQGLQGVFYIDARGLQGDDKYGGYAWYDHHLLQLYDLVKQRSTLKVVLDKNPDVFPPGSCPDAALYCGWYSLAKYVPAFKWVKGAVGFHVASAEATTLKQQGSNVWCKRMLEEGVAATLGPVAEPYLHVLSPARRVFPAPHERPDSRCWRSISAPCPTSPGCRSSSATRCTRRSRKTRPCGRRRSRSQRRNEGGRSGFNGPGVLPVRTVCIQMVFCCPGLHRNDNPP